MRNLLSAVQCLTFLTIFLAAGSGKSDEIVAAKPSIQPPSDAAKSVFMDSPADFEPKVRNAYRKENEGQHFRSCDEQNLHLFEPLIRGIGGGYIGVGTDQAYFFIGWGRSEYAWLIDYDPVVVQLHQIYKAFFVEATTPEQFMALWTTKSRDQARKVISDQIPDPDLRKDILRGYEQGRGIVLTRLVRASKDLKAANVSSFITDQDSYTFVRDLVMSGRVRPMLVNLLGNGGMLGIARASKIIGVPMRIMYLSNVEDYWAYSPAYVANLRAQNFDEKSMVLRTLASKNTNGDYTYVAQSGLNLFKWLDDGKVRRTRNMFAKGALRGQPEIPFVKIDNEPVPPVDKASEIKK